MQGEMTIDELARRAGTTVRNVRAHQTRGLLPPPRMAGRVGYYGGAHLARLSYIARLQRRGFSLAAVHDLLRAWEEGRSVGDVLGFEEALTAPWGDDVPERFTRAELDAMFPEIVADESLVERAVRLGLLVRDGDAFQAPRPRLIRVGAELVAAGIPLAAVLDQHVLLVDDMRRVAARMVRLFEDHVWEPFVAAGLPPERLAAITDALHRLRPVASAAVLSALAEAMEDAVASSAAEHAARLVVAPGPAARGAAAAGGAVSSPR